MQLICVTQQSTRCSAQRSAQCVHNVMRNGTVHDVVHNTVQCTVPFALQNRLQSVAFFMHDAMHDATQHTRCNLLGYYVPAHHVLASGGQWINYLQCMHVEDDERVVGMPSYVT